MNQAESTLGLWEAGYAFGKYRKLAVFFQFLSILGANAAIYIPEPRYRISALWTFPAGNPSFLSSHAFRISGMAAGNAEYVYTIAPIDAEIQLLRYQAPYKQGILRELCQHIRWPVLELA